LGKAYTYLSMPAKAAVEDWAPKFKEITNSSFTEQAIWFLNGFWNDGLDKQAEKLWTWVHTCIEIDTGKPKMYGSKTSDLKEGNELDELKSHVFLEKMKETLTVVELRKRLKALDIDNNNKMALAEYMLDALKKTPQQLVNAPQGDSDPVKLAAAQAACQAAGDALSEATSSEAACKQAQAEVTAALAEVQAQEKAYNDKLAALEAASNDSKSGAVKQNKAKNELAQLKGEDPLALRKAKLTLSAALKRAEKATALAQEKLAAAEAAFAEAEAMLEAIKKAGGGAAKGRIWWMERELTEKKKYMPKR